MKWQMNISLQKKKLLTRFCTAIFFLFAGIEYAVILPTLNDYLQNEFHAKQFFYGLVLSAFSLSGLLVAPFFGIWYDRTHKTKMMILFANMWEIAGNILYFIGLNKYYVLGGRLLAGVGAGVGSAIFAVIAQTTTEAERASAISLLMAARQFGLLFGPGLNLGLQKCDFYIGKFPVNKYTSPGLFMAILWVLQNIVFLFIYFDIPTLEEQRRMEQQANGRPCRDYATLSAGSINGGSSREISNGGQTLITDRYEQAIGQHGILSDAMDGGGPGEYISALPQEEAYMQHHNGHALMEEDEGDSKEKEKPPGFCWSLNECLNEEIVVMLAVQFVFYFNQPGLETAVVPLNELYLDFSEIDNSIFYCVCGVELLIFFLVVKVISKKVSDRTILLVGLVIELVSLALLTIFVPRAIEHDPKHNFAMFIIPCAIQVSGLAFLAVSIISLFSKIVPEKIQGFSQGIRRATGGLATIMGPIWSAATVERPFLMLIVMVVLFALALLMVLASWKRLKTNYKEMPIPTSDILSVNNETEPLLPEDNAIVT
ncbi:major facilitator superfamily domain-containing protein 8-like [Diadema antillarum]|uniref:major facilitator superfamily domain-containing protein 8-like n=1 Tax=Diadema antillarum TaxID=105358 RepID=UPI003A888F0A